MLSGLQHHLQPGLEVVDNYIKREYLLRAGSISNFINVSIDKAELNWPVLLLMSFAKIGNKTCDKVYPLSAVLKLVFIANSIHCDAKESLQYKVLIGDYFYAKFLTYLCNYGLLEWLPTFARLICNMQEAKIIRAENYHWEIDNNTILEIVDKEAAEIAAESCYMGAVLGAADKNIIELSRVFGLNFGRGIELLNYPERTNLIIKYLSEAQESLFLLPPTAELKILAKIIEGLKKGYSIKLLKLSSGV